MIFVPSPTMQTSRPLFVLHFLKNATLDVREAIHFSPLRFTSANRGLALNTCTILPHTVATPTAHVRRCTTLAARDCAMRRATRDPIF
mmetsp:Transcript_8215/g.10757  ORF Transcript_8215/g.10757 Transcript_8215/m.10757 type:complete len:88 (-) Transcript_8215:235-498(-)